MKKFTFALTIFIAYIFINQVPFAVGCITKEANHLYICSFNIYILGNVEAKYDALEDEYEGQPVTGTPQRIKNLANVLAVGKFDLIVIQELDAGERGEWALSDLKEELNNTHGCNYSHFKSADIGQGWRCREAMGFLYDSNIVQPQIIPGTTSMVQNISVPWSGGGSSPRGIIRTGWVAGDFDFTMYSVHLEWTNEAKRNAGYDFVEEIITTPTPSSYSNDPDIIILGDFNRLGGGHESIKRLDYDANVFFAPNVTFFDPTFNTVRDVPASAVAGVAGLNNNPQFLSTTVSDELAAYDMFLMTSDVDKEYPGTASASVYGKDFGILQYDEVGGCGYQAGAENLAHTPLKKAYSDHRPLWMRFQTNAAQSDSGTATPAPQHYVATATGKKFHLPNCWTIRGKATPKQFNTRAAAINGLAPCSVCNP